MELGFVKNQMCAKLGLYVLHFINGILRGYWLTEWRKCLWLGTHPEPLILEPGKLFPSLSVRKLPDPIVMCFNTKKQGHQTLKWGSLKRNKLQSCEVIQLLVSFLTGNNQDFISLWVLFFFPLSQTSDWFCKSPIHPVPERRALPAMDMDRPQLWSEGDVKGTSQVDLFSSILAAFRASLWWKFLCLLFAQL